VKVCSKHIVLLNINLLTACAIVTDGAEAWARKKEKGKRKKEKVKRKKEKVE
jgi:undecaprenyl pyrophosphate synthase